MFLVKSELSITTYLFLVFYRSTSLQSRSFLESINTFLYKQKLVNNCSIPSKQQPQNHDTFSKILTPFTTLQFRLFLKNIKNFLCKYKIVNNCSIPSTHAERKITIRSHKHSFTSHPSLSPYRQTELQREKYTCCALAGGTFFPVMLLCQFLVLVRNRFWFYLLCTYVWYLEYNTVVVLCQFFGSGGK